MSREEVQKLLGGYATGTLTAEEQQALFEAALDDQELFDTLAREQGLRDLLRDPAAKAEVLAALDEPARSGFWAWLRRPVVAGVAMAGLAAVGVVVWQGARKPVEAPVIVAQLKPQPAETRAEAPAPATAPAQPRLLQNEKRTYGTLRQVAPAAAPAAPPPNRRDSNDLTVDGAVVAQAKPAELNASQQTAPAMLNSQNLTGPPPQAVNQMQQAQVNVMVQAVEEKQMKKELADDAKALFYQQSAGTGRNGLVAFDATSGAVGGAAEPAKAKAAKKSAPAGTPLAQLAAGFGGGFVANPGVRCSILRGDREVDLSTVLTAGESVRLRLTPNTGGILSVYEGDGDSARLVATGPAQPMKPFETPALKSDTAGLKQIRVTLTLVSMMKTATPAADARSRANLVESAADKEAATYMVLKDARPATQQVVMSITLTWR